MLKQNIYRGIEKTFTGLIVSVLLASGMSLFITTEIAHAAGFASGSGSISNPYKIADCDQLQNIADNSLSAYYELNNNIDCSGTAALNSGRGFSPIGDDTTPFTGNFDGKGFAINNITMQRADNVYGEDPDGADQTYVGIFGKSQNAVLKNVTLNDAMIKGYRHVGGLVGYSDNSTISNIHVNDNVEDNDCNPGTCIWARLGENGGGIVGYMKNGTLYNSTSGGNVKGSGKYIGGIVGYADNATISNSSSSANIDGGEKIGGIVGLAVDSTISFVHATGSVNVVEEDYKSGNYGGGVIGFMSKSTLSNSYASGSVTASSWAGGLVGQAVNSTVEMTHASGVVTAFNSAGGLIGAVYGLNDDAPRTAIVRDSYATGVVSAYTYAGGLIGNIEASQGNYIVQRTYATGNIIKTYSESSHDGGLIGSATVGSDNESVNASGIIEDSYATGSINDSNYFSGGLIGYMYTYNYNNDAVVSNTIRRTYSTGNVSSSYIFGGLIGYSTADDNPRVSVNLSDNFTVSEVIPLPDAEYPGGFLGSGSGRDPAFSNNYYYSSVSESNYYCASIEVKVGCTGVTEVSQFKNNSTNTPFKNGGVTIWDFDNVWKTKTSDYPILRSTIPVGESSSVNLSSAENGTKIKLEQTGCLIIGNTNTSKESSAAVQDPAYSYPLGFVGFRLTGCPIGGTATVKVIYTGKYNTSSVIARKYNSSNNSYSTVNNASVTNTTLDGQDAIEITYTITDGGSLDQDGTANGAILDPVGLAQQVVGAPNTGTGSKQ